MIAMILYAIICCQVLLDSMISMWHYASMPRESREKLPKNRGTTGTWIVRDVPQEIMRKARVAAAVQGRSVKAILIELMEGYLQELEKKGILPKGK